MDPKNITKVYKMSFASVYPHYVSKIERKGCSKVALHEIIMWLTGYSEVALMQIIGNKTDFETFFNEAPALNPKAKNIKGVICGDRIETISDPLIQQVRWLDKLVDELAKGKTVDKIINKLTV